VWPPNASFYASSTYGYLRLLASPFDQGLDCILAELTKAKLSEAKRAAAKILSLKHYQKWFLFYEISRSLETVNVLAFPHVKVKSKVIYEDISFPSFFRKILISAFLLRLKDMQAIHGYKNFAYSSCCC